jgi:hypothetical protein
LQGFGVPSPNLLQLYHNQIAISPFVHRIKTLFQGRLLLLWSGAAWIRGLAEARTVTWCYVLCGAIVNLTDMTIFICRAKPGTMRNWMLVLDGVALAIPLGLGIWLLASKTTEKRHPDDSDAVHI